MLQSRLFTKTRKDAPKDEVARNAELLIRGGYIHKEMAGAYDYLPLGLRVIEKIKKIVRDEMNSIGGEELSMTSLQRKELWQSTDRWSDEKVDVWFKSALKNGSEVGFGWSHEEPITDMMKNFVSSYRDLPVYVYQFQTKLRNELRAKSGIMRGREFLMKDLYSYSVSEESHKKFYDSVTEAYMRIFERVGLGDRTYLTFASGGAFTQFSHEFQTLLPAGEDTIYVDRKQKIAVNKEVMNDKVLGDLGLNRDDLKEEAAAEVGNIFSFGGIKSEQLGLYFKNENGDSMPVILGSYGIGISRLMGVVVEALSDDKGIVWPKEIAPFRAHVISINQDEEAKKVYEALKSGGIEVLFDDRDAAAGEKFADADLLGIPSRVVVGKTAGEGAYELKDRKSGETKNLSLADLTAELRN